jgi:hypothetical protein
MPDAMMNGGYAPYLAQALTPQGIPGGIFGAGAGNVPGNFFNNPLLGQSYGQGGPFGGISPFAATPQFGQAFGQANPWWQPPQQQGQMFGQTYAWWPQPQPQIGQTFGQPYTGQTYAWWPQPQQQIGQTVGQPYAGQANASWQEVGLLAHLLRQYAVPISAVIASPYGQVQIAQNIMQTAEMLTRVLPLVGASQLVPLAQLLGQCAQPLSAAIASPYGQAHIAQHVAQTAEMLARVLPLAAQQQQNQAYGQPLASWQQPMVPQLPTANLLFGQQVQNPVPQVGATPFASSLGAPIGGVPLGQFSAQPNDILGRGILPFLAQQNLAGQAYGLARV